MTPLRAFLVLLAVLAASDASAGGLTSTKHRQYASTRARRADGTFLPVAEARRAVRVPLRGRGYANPSRVGKSTAEVAFTPATARRTGAITVTLPEMYLTADAPAASPLTLFAADIRGTPIALAGTLSVGAPTSTGFRSARFDATVPSGAVLAREAITAALDRSRLHVQGVGLAWRSSW